MNFKIQASPHIRTTNASVDNMMRNVLIALIPVVFFATLQFKLQFILALFISIVVVCGLEFLSNVLMKKAQTLRDLSGLVTAVIFALTLPIGIFNGVEGSSVKGYLVGTIVITLSGAFAILIGKMIFGGLGKNIFNPAGLGRIFMLISFGAIVSYFASDITYSATATPLAVAKTSIETGAVNSILDVTKSYSITELFLGRASGSFGEVNALAILLSAGYLMVFKIADWRKIVAALGTFSLLAFIYAWRVDISNQFILVELFSGSILFGTVFMVTDPVTAPVTAPGRVFYAIMIGGLTFVIRMFGSYPEGMLFAILFMNMFTPAIDYHRWANNRFNLTWIITNVLAVLLFVGIILIGTK